MEWHAGRLTGRYAELQKRWPGKGVLILREDILDIVRRLESKEVYTANLGGVTPPSLFGMYGSSIVETNMRGLLVGLGISDQKLTFLGEGFTFGQSSVVLVNSEEEEFTLYCLRGELARGFSVAVAVASEADAALAVAFDAASGRLTITLGTDGEGAPDDGKNELGKIALAMQLVEGAASNFAFGLTSGQDELSLDKVVAAQDFDEPDPFYGDDTKVTLFGQGLSVLNLLPDRLEASAPASLLDHEGVIGAAVAGGVTLHGLLTISGLAFDYHVHTAQLPPE